MKKFKKIYIEITDICNLNCAFCPGHKRKKEYMSAENFEKVLQKTHMYGENFYLHLMGEPLGHPQFAEILDICSRYNIQTNITTNGTLLKHRCDDILKHNIRSVCISLHSFGANRMNISLQQYLDDIKDFCLKAKGKRTTVELRLWNMSRESLSDSTGLNYKIIEYFNDNLNPDFNIFTQLEQTFLSMERNRKKNFRITENIFLGMAEQFSWPSLENSPNKVCEGFCYGLRNQIAILTDGTVVPCCLDSNGDMALGNIFEQSLEDIYNSDRSRRIYNGFTNQKAIEPLCQSCGYMKKYMAMRLK